VCNPIRTRTGSAGGQSWVARARWAATAAWTAPAGLAKAAKNESPSVLTSTPPPAAIASRKMTAAASRTTP
jgi:hypothetical protein